MTGKSIFSPDYATQKQLQTIAGAEIGEYRAKITSNVSETAKRKGEQFSEEISRRFVADFEKKTDKMAHVSTFALINDTIKGSILLVAVIIQLVVPMIRSRIKTKHTSEV